MNTGLQKEQNIQEIFSYPSELARHWLIFWHFLFMNTSRIWGGFLLNTECENPAPYFVQVMPMTYTEHHIHPQLEARAKLPHKHSPYQQLARIQQQIPSIQSINNQESKQKLRVLRPVLWHLQPTPKWLPPQTASSCPPLWSLLGATSTFSKKYPLLLENMSSLLGEPRSTVCTSADWPCLPFSVSCYTSQDMHCFPQALKDRKAEPCMRSPWSLPSLAFRIAQVSRNILIVT